MNIEFSIATEADAPALTALQIAVADGITRPYGQGGWSGVNTEKGILFGMRHSRVLIARSGNRIVASLRLPTKKPWAIDVSYFTPVKKALYLVGMAVHPELQLQRIGRKLIAEAVKQARAWPADAIRLDAFDAEAGAGPFYLKCGLTDRGHVIYRNAPLIYFEMLL